MALPFTDDFTNSDGTALETHNASWDSVTDVQEVNSNRLDSTNGSNGAEGIARWTGDTFDDDQKSTGTLNVAGSGFVEMGVSTRVSSDGDGYEWITSASGDAYMGRHDNGSVTNLSNPSLGSISSDDILEITSEGTTHTGFHEAAQETQQTDATYSSGSAGIAHWENGAAVALDSITVANLSENTSIEVPTGPWR